MDKIKLVIGPPVEGDNFFGREREQKQIWRKLQSNNLLMLAPRRIGKTSLLKKLRDTAPAHNSHVLYCSFAGCQDELSCINEILKSLDAQKSLQTSVMNSLKKVKGVKFAGFGIDFSAVENHHWSVIGESLTVALKEASTSAAKNGEQNKSLVICVDELPIFILRQLKLDDGLEKVRAFLNWFRNIRQTHAADIKWILAGSIGLDTVTKRLNIGDTINDLQPYPIGAFDQKSAQQLLRNLAQSYELKLSVEMCDVIIAKVGWAIPYYLQIMLETLLDTKADITTSINEADIDNAFSELLTPEFKSYFDYWRQRLTEELGAPDDSHAIHLLNQICQDPDGVSRASLSQALTAKMGDPAHSDEQLMYLLDVLQSDGYIIEHHERYKFRLMWLKAYWKKRVAP